MGLNFPNAPTEGQIFAPPGAPQYTFRANAWRSEGKQDLITSATPPLDPKPGQLWWNSNNGRTYIWYVDADSGQWIQIANSGAVVDETTSLGERFASLHGVNGVPKGTTLASTPDETAAIQAFLLQCSTDRVKAIFDGRRQYGFTNVSVGQADGFFWVDSVYGTARFVQLPGRDLVAMGFHMQGSNTAAGTAVLSGAVAQGATQIPLISASQVKPGNLLDFKSARLLPGDNRYDGNACAVRMPATLVTKVVGNIVTIAEPMRWPFRPPTIIASGAVQAATAETVTLAVGTDVTARNIKNFPIRITSGTAAGQQKYVAKYDPATLIVDIGVSISGYNGTAWSPVPAPGDIYEIYDDTTITNVLPADIYIGAVEFVGYPEPSLDPVPDLTGPRGVYLPRSRLKLRGTKFRDFSLYNCFIALSYRPEIDLIESRGANDAETDGDGYGYGLLVQSSYAPIIRDPIISNCRSMIDISGGTVGATVRGGYLTGGGLTAKGKNFWPIPEISNGGLGVSNCGCSTHTGAVDTTWEGITIRDVADFGKVRGLNERYLNNKYEGTTRYGLLVFYSDGVLVQGGSYRTGYGNSSYSVDGVGNVSGAERLMTPEGEYAGAMPSQLVSVQYYAMQEFSDVTVMGVDIVGIGRAIVHADDTNAVLSDFSPSVTVINNRMTLTNREAGGGSGYGAPVFAVNPCAWRSLRVANNEVTYGGLTPGSIITDNINYYRWADNITNTQLVVPLGNGLYLVHLDDDKAISIQLGKGVTRFGLAIHERKNVLFGGLALRYVANVLLGSTTPDDTPLNLNSLVALSTASLSGTTGADGKLTVSLRTPETDGRISFENRLGATAQLIVHLRGVL